MLTVKLNELKLAADLYDSHANNIHETEASSIEWTVNEQNI